MDSRLRNLPKLALRPRDAYVAQGAWGQAPIWARVRDTARRTPKKPAVVDADGAWSYDDLWREALRFAAAMTAAGLEPRDIALVQLPNWREFVALSVACELTRVVFAFCPIQWGLRETSTALALIRPRAWFTTARPRAGDDRSELIRAAWGSCDAKPQLVLLRSDALGEGLKAADWLAMAPSVSAGDDREGGRGLDPLEIAVTSGSTGEPKGVLHVHDSALATVGSTIARQGITSADVVHLAIPVGHTFGYFYGVRCALQACGTLVLQERWDAEGMLALAHAHRVSISLGPAAFILDLLALPPEKLAALASLRLFTHSGDSLPAPTARRARETLPFRISRALGMTEFGHTTATDAGTPPDRAIDSLGTAQPEMEIAIADADGKRLPANAEGRILVRGPFVFAGYLTRERLNEDVLDADGFFDTADLGLLDEGGYLHITGRVKNVIRRGAETIPVSFLEDVISALPQVAHVVVIGMPDPRFGEAPVACVQLRANASLGYAELAAEFEARGVTKKFWPVSMELIDAWPIGPTGKIDRRMIIEKISAKT